jgi:hypothetical protein
MIFDILRIGFPFSYFGIYIAFIFGIILTLTTVSFFTIIIFFLFVYLGCFRITPILEFISKIIHNLFPNLEKNITKGLCESFQVKNFLKSDKKQHIFLFHPHGAFCASYFFHKMTNITDWPNELRTGKTTVLRYLFWLPFGREILENFGAIPNCYRDMKQVLQSGETLSVIPGGIREMYECEPAATSGEPCRYTTAATSCKKGVLRLKLKERTGVFRLALETGTSIVPVLSYGENELYSLLDFPVLRKIQKWLEKFDLILPIPSFTSIQKWYSVLQGSFKNPIQTVIGDAVEVEKKENISSEDIEALKQKYMDILQDLYSKTKPDNYSEKIIFL